MAEKTEAELEADKKAEEDKATAESKKTEILIPKARFDEVNEQRKKAEEALAAKEKADKEAEDKRLKEKEDFKTLAEQREAELEALRKQNEADKADAEAKAKKAQYESSVIAAAAKLDFADPLDAVAHLKGDVEDVEAAVKKLGEDKPYLLKQDGKFIKLKANKGVTTDGEEDDAERRKRLLG